MAKKPKNHSAGGDGRAPWLQMTAFAVLTAHSAFSAYLARDDARLVALVAVGYLLMLLLLFYGMPAVLQKRD